MTFLIIAFALLILANIFGLIYLRSNLRGIQQENNSIYEREIESRKSQDLSNAPEKTAVSKLGNAPVETVITYKDLTDIDEIQSGHMIL